MRLIPVLFLLLTAGAVGAQESLPSQLDAVRIEQRPGEQVPLDAVFRNESGRTVRLGDCLADKPVVLVLAYFRCPKLCSVVLTGVVDSLSKIRFDAGENFTVIVVDFDPREGPALAAAAKASYLDRYGRNTPETAWHFLTGKEPEIRKVADAVGFRYAFDPQRNEYAHGSGIMILTPEGKVARYFFGIEFPARDLRLALVEASEGRISAPLERALLLACLGYDPASGTYRLIVMKVMRLAAVLTVLLMGIYIGRQWWLERRARRGRPESLSGGRVGQ